MSAVIQKQFGQYVVGGIKPRKFKQQLVLITDSLLLLLPMNFFNNGKKYFGLAISETSLKGVFLEKRSKKVIGFGRSELPDDTFQNGVLVNRKAFLEAINNVFKTGNFYAPFVVSCLLESYVFSKVITLPLTKIEEIEDAVRFQAKEFLLFPEEEVYFDWKIVKKEKEETEILLVATPKVIIDKIIEAYESIHLKPLSFLTSSLALLELLKDEEKTLILVDLGTKEAILTVVFHRSPVLTTTVSPSIVSSSLNKLRDFYEQKNRNEKIEKLVLSGPAATGELANNLSLELKIPAQILPIISVFGPQGNEALSFARALGAAGAQIALPRSENTINLLPPEFEEKYQKEEERVKERLLGEIALFFFVFLFLLSFLTLILLVSFEKKTDRQISDILKKQQEKEISDVEKKVEFLNKEAVKIEKIFKLKTPLLSNLLTIEKLTGQEINLLSLSYDETKKIFHLSGLAKDRNSLLSFKESLLQTKIFKKVQIPLSSLERATDINFEIIFSIEKDEK